MKKLLFLLVISTAAPAATIVVNTTELLLAAADDGECTMHEAVAAANDNLASGVTAGECVAGEAMPIIDVIEFEAGILPAHIDLANPLELSESVEVRGPGRDLLSFTNQLGSRVFKIQSVPSSVEILIADLSLINNVLDHNIDTDGGAVFAALGADTQLTFKRILFDTNHADDAGGAISLFGLLSGSNNVTIKDCQFLDNSAESNLVSVIGGGALFIGSNLNVTIEGSTFLNNRARNFGLSNEIVAGGAILIRSNQTFLTTVSILSSTFSDNQTTGFGGAVAIGGLASVTDASEVTIEHATVTQNQADIDNEQPDGSGGGVYSSSTFDTRLFNSIIANNTDIGVNSAPNMSGNFASLGFNFIGDNSSVSGTFPLGLPNINDDLVGDNSSPLNPLLSTISDNGGPTSTLMPMSNSLVIDHGNCNGQSADQRNFHNNNTGLRIFDDLTVNNSSDGCDIGAVERNTDTANPIPITTNDNYQILEGQALVRSVVNGLLSNDSDNNPLVIVDPFTFDFNSSSVPGIGTIGIYGDIQFITNNADANGQAQLQYTVTDQSNQASATMSLNILPVNDPPSFTAGTLIIAAPKEQLQTLPAWASDISVGPANENSQTATFVISTVPTTGFFSAGPEIDSNSGDLIFTLSSNASGIADVTVLLKDSGGVSNGGLDASSTVNFTVEAIDSVIFKNGFE